MRRKILTVTIAALFCITICALTACGNGLDSLQVTGLPDSFDGMDIVEGQSSFELYCEAYESFLNESNYKRVQYYDFSTTSGAKQSMQIKTTRKIDGAKIYTEEVVLATGIMTLNEGKKVYFNNDEAYSLYFNDKTLVPGIGDDVFAVASWDKFGAYDDVRYGEKSQTKFNYKNQLCSYNLSKAEFLADDNDNKVYTQDKKIYISLTIDCSESAMKGVQREVAESIAKKTASSPNDLKMKSNTRIRAEVKKIDGKFKFVYLEISEEYKGKLSIFSAECKAMYYNEFYYGDAVGTATDAELYGIANL